MTINTNNDNNNSDLDYTNDDDENTNLDLEISDGDGENDEQDSGGDKEISRTEKNARDPLAICGMLNSIYYPARFFYSYERHQLFTQLTSIDDALYNITSRVKNDGFIALTQSNYTLQGFAQGIATFSFSVLDKDKRLDGKLRDELVICRDLLHKDGTLFPQGTLPQYALELHNEMSSDHYSYPHLCIPYGTKPEREFALKLFRELKRRQFISADLPLITENNSVVLPLIDVQGIKETYELNASLEKKNAMFNDLEELGKSVKAYGKSNSKDPTLTHLNTLGDSLSQQVNTYKNDSSRNVMAFKKDLHDSVEKSEFTSALKKNHDSAKKHSGILWGIVQVIFFAGTALLNNVKKKLPPSFLDSPLEKSDKIKTGIDKKMDKIIGITPHSVFSAGSSASQLSPNSKSPSSTTSPKVTVKFRY